MIDRCPRCCYSLRGLPTVHRCPECGLQCDSDAVVFREPRIAWVCVASLTAGLLLWRAVSTFAGIGRSWDWWANTPLVALLAVLIWWLTRQRHMVIVSPRYLQIHGRSSTPEIFAIEDIGDAHWSYVTGTISISDRFGDTNVTIPSRFLAAAWRSRKVVIELKKVLRDKGVAIGGF